MFLEASISTRSTSTTFNAEPKRIVSSAPPLHLRLAYFIGLVSFRSFFKISLGARRLFSRRRKDLLLPTVKSYPIRPDLKNRIFRPENCEDEKLPLYLDVHGGGWAVADPQTDDEFCSYLAQNFNIVVVSINYHKSPTYKFPHAVEDVAAIAHAVINDRSLRIDRSKAALGGFSAGGNLAFAAAQTSYLRGRLSGLVGLYPALDLSEPLEEKLSHRPRGAPSDILKSSANFLGWAYVPADTNLRDPLLSPRWADYKDLPSHVYLLGAEYDLLCHEAGQMAQSLALNSAPDRERIRYPEMLGDGWQQGGIRWECARGKQHAFTHVEKHGRKEAERVRFCQELYSRIGSWLKEDVWAGPNMR
jgi:acetyl esterase/lipase